jgi:plastocyanin
MNKRSPGKAMSRRQLFKLTGGATFVAAGAGLLPFKKLLGPLAMTDAAAQASTAPDLYFAGTDGWMSLPPTPSITSASLGGVVTHPDSLAPSPFSTYIFGFRNVTGMTDAQRAAQKNKAQHVAPLFWVDQFNPAAPKDFKIRLTNLGLALRPDLFDAHTIHWHGFRNVITFFDGEPTGSVAVTTGRTFDYIYRPRDPGTYMFHCHVEDVEHVQMGMTGPVFVRPLQNGNTTFYPSGKYAYNDGNGSTGYDREYAMLCSEVWCDSHWADAHIQLPEWSDYRADFSLLNGRAYPDTLVRNAPLEPTAIDTPAKRAALHALPIQVNALGDLVAPADRLDLQYQPLSALVECNAGDRVLLRFANLGFKESAMTLAGIKMRVVGKDATPMLGRDGTDTSYDASTVSMGAGESIDAIFTAPAKTGPGAYDTYVLYDRAYERTNNLGGGGRRTEIRVYASGALAPQTIPNT